MIRLLWRLMDAIADVVEEPLKTALKLCSQRTFIAGVDLGIAFALWAQGEQLFAVAWLAFFVITALGAVERGELE